MPRETPSNHSYNVYINDHTASLIDSFVREMGPPVTKAGFASYIVQTYILEAMKSKREIEDFCQKRLEKKWDTLKKARQSYHQSLVQQPLPIESGQTEALIRAFKDMLQPFQDENRMLKDELERLKRDLGC